MEEDESANSPRAVSCEAIEPSNSQRAIPCEGCVRAGIAGKGDLGRCYNVESGRSRRCFSCKSGGHRCVKLHPVLIPLARRMLLALDVDTKMYNRCRQALRLQLELIAEPDSVYAEYGASDEGAVGGPLAAEKEAKVATVMTRLEEVVRLLV
ncbi:hypothetical protein E4U41_001919 [Claviceps citrina]|nr:hypothetical protein E4U41_001919 [Claviceps citrina]